MSTSMVGRWPRPLSGIRDDIAVRAARFPRPTRALSRPAAFGLVACCYLAGFGWGLFSAVWFLVADDVGPATYTTGIDVARAVLLEELPPMLVTVPLTIVLGLWLYGVNIAARPAGPAKSSAAVAVGEAASTVVGVLLASLVLGAGGGFPTAEVESVWNDIATYFSLATAGVREEFVFAALIPIVLRAAGLRWRWIILTSVVLRLSFHLYYGADVVGLAPWAVTTVLLFICTRRIWPLVFAHGAWDVIIYSVGAGQGWVTVAALTFVLAALVVLIHRHGWSATRGGPPAA